MALGLSSASGFAPPSAGRSASLRMEQDLTPKDLIASNMRLRKAYGLTNTLRWEIRSTLTSDEEAAKTKTAEGAEGDLPPFPELMKNGIYDIQNAEQHK